MKRFMVGLTPTRLIAKAVVAAGVIGGIVAAPSAFAASPSGITIYSSVPSPLHPTFRVLGPRPMPSTSWATQVHFAVVSSTTRSIRGADLVRPDDPDYLDALIFLMAEAEILDAADLVGWLSFLAPEIVYTVPVQTTRLRENPATGSAASFHLNEDRGSLEFRVKRLVESNAAWAENPASRTRRFVSNVRVRRTEGTELRVSSYLLLMRSRHDRDTYDLISAERNDLLGRTEEGELELRNRQVTVDQARLGIAPIPFPL